MKGRCECEDITHFEDGAPERLAQRYQAHDYQKTDATAEAPQPKRHSMKVSRRNER